MSTSSGQLRIGLFDSGIGGLSLLRDVHAVLPAAEYYYIADRAYAPYGKRSPEEILERSHQLASELVQEDIHLLIVACNTATAWAIASLRQTFSLPIVGIEPWLNIVNQMDGNKSRLVALTTEGTARSEKFLALKQKVDPKNQIQVFPCPTLAENIEKLFHGGDATKIWPLIAEELAPVQSAGHTHAILGCTHYPLVASRLEEMLGLATIDPGRAVAERVRSLLQGISTQGPKTTEFNYKDTLERIWLKKSLTWGLSL